jgi:hypothetical protein
LPKRKSRPASRAARRRLQRRPLVLEQLEDRVVPTVKFTPLYSGTFETGDTVANHQYSLHDPTVDLIFAGTYWTQTPQGQLDRNDLANSVFSLMNPLSPNSHYFDALAQYGFQGTVHTGQNFQNDFIPILDVANNTLPGIGSLESYIQTFIHIIKGLNVQSNHMYFVIIDPTVVPSAPTGGGNISPIPDVGAFLQGIVVAPKFLPGSLVLDKDSFTRSASHELAENIVSDVHVSDPRMLRGGFQICDNEPEVPPNYYTYRINGELVQAYWSQQDGAWVVPDANSQVITLVPHANTNNLPDGTYGLSVGTPNAPFDGTLTLSETIPGSLFDVQVITVNNQVFAIPGSQLTGVSVNAGAGNDVVNVDGIVAPLVVNLGSGSDTVNLTPMSQDLGNLHQKVSVSGRLGVGAGFSMLNIDDQAFGYPANYTVTFSSLQRFAPTFLTTTPTITYSGINQTNVNGGTNVSGVPGADIFNLSPGGAYRAIVNGGTGSNIFNVQTGVSGVTLNGSTGTDTLNGVATAILTGSSSAGFKGFSNGINFSGIDVLNGTGTLFPLIAASTWTVNAVNSNSFYSDGSHNLTFSGFNTLGGSGSNIFNLQPGASGVTLNGSNSTDTLTGVVNAVLSGSSSAGFSGTAANGITFSGIDVLKGTGALTGENADPAATSSAWTVNAVTTNSTYFDGGDFLTFSGFSTLNGAPGNNTFNLHSGASGYTINGGSGFLNSLIGVANASLSGSSSAGFSGTAANGITFSGIDLLQGTGTLTGENAASTWTVNAAATTTSTYADGNATLNFGGFNTLNAGNAGTSSFNGNIFNLQSGASGYTINGFSPGLNSLTGVANPVLSGSSSTGFSGTADNGIAFTNINTLVGTGALTGDNANSQWLLSTSTGFSIYTVGNNTLAFSGISTLNGGTGGNTFTLPSSSFLGGALTINGHGSGNSLIVNDQGAQSNMRPTITITPTGFSRTQLLSFPWSVTLTGIQTETFNVSGPTTVQGTAQGTSTTIDVFGSSTAASPPVFLGQVDAANRGTLQKIQGPVTLLSTVPGGTPNNLPDVTLNDFNDTAVHNVFILSTVIINLSPSPIFLSAASVRVLDIGGSTSTSGSTYTIVGTPAAEVLQLSAPGPDVVNVQATAAGIPGFPTTTAILAGNGGGHIFNVGSTNDAHSTVDAIQGLLEVISGSASASDTLNINDQGSTTGHIYNITPGATTSTYTRSAPGTPTVTITFSNILNLQRHDGALLGSPTQAAELSFPSTIAAGRFATMSGRLVGTGELSLSVAWGDGTPPAHRTPDLRPFSVKHKYARPGTYRVLAVWTDSSGQSGFRQLTITVTPAGDDDNGGGGGGAGSGSSSPLFGEADGAVDSLGEALVWAAQGSPAGKAAVQAFFDAAGAPFNQQIDPMRLPEQPALAGAGLTGAGTSDPWAGSKELDLFFAGLSDLLPDWNTRKEVVVG